MDWKSLMADLKASGLSIAEIAAKCDCGYGTVADLATGDTQQPRYDLGVRLRLIHRKAKRKLAAQEKAGAV